jgi:hypothetical protein
LKKPEAASASAPQDTAQAAGGTEQQQQQQQQQEEEEADSADSAKSVHGRILAPVGEPPLFEKNWPTMRGALWVGTLTTKVPDTFVATSHEYSRIFDYGAPQPALLMMLKHGAVGAPVVHHSMVQCVQMTILPWPAPLLVGTALAPATPLTSAAAFDSMPATALQLPPARWLSAI